jgi:Tfp pilus assembly protein PilV
LSRLNIYRYRQLRGGTLVEVLVAIAIITFVLLPFVLITLLSLRTARQADVQIASYQAAQEQLEYLRAFSFSNLIIGKEANFALPTSVQSSYGNLGIQGTYRIDAGPTANLRQVSVEVRWNSTAVAQSSNVVSRVRVTSLIAKP